MVLHLEQSQDDHKLKSQAVVHLGVELMRYDMGITKASMLPDWDKWLQLEQETADLLLTALERQPKPDFTEHQM